MVLGVVSLETLELICVGMAPTIVAWALNREREPYGPLSVAALNFAGIVPFLPDSLGMGQGPFADAGLLSDSFVWLVMYGAAAIGWLFYLGVPPLAAALSQSRADRLAVRLRRRQKELVIEWGPDIAGKPAPREGSAPEAG